MLGIDFMFVMTAHIGFPTTLAAFRGVDIT